MSYASLAGLPYQYGLYGAFIPPIVYALLGSSRQLAVGPVAGAWGLPVPMPMLPIPVPGDYLLPCMGAAAAAAT